MQRALWAVPLLVLFCGAVLLISGGPHALAGFPLDDAWIHRVYARSFAHLQGFAYNPGQQETGATSPLWAIVSAPAHWLQPAGDRAVVLAVKWIAVLAAGAAALGVARLGQLVSGRFSVGIIAASIVAAEPRLALAAVSGMETPLALALWFWGAALVVEGRPLAGPLLLGLAITARPEMVVISALTVLPGTILAARNPSQRRPVLAGLGLAAVPPLLWSGFCLAVTGRPLPATFYVKARAFVMDDAAWHHFVALLAQPGWMTLSIAIAGGVSAVVLLVLRGGRVALTVGLSLGFAPLLLHLLVVGGRGIRLDGYYWTRWGDPQALGLLAMFALGISWLLVGPSGGARLRLVGRVVAVSVLVLSLPAVTRAWSESRGRLESDSRAIELMNVQPARWVARTVPDGQVVGVNDAGAFRYFGEHEIIDLVGLNYHPKALGRTDLTGLYERVDWIAVFPAWWRRTNLLEHFDEARRFTIPVEQYTVCDCPGQTELVVAAKRGGGG